MWFGTADGLNKYDGYSFTIYRNRRGDSTSLPDNAIRTLYEDREGNLWVGTDKGLSRYSRASDSFIRTVVPDRETNKPVSPLYPMIIQDRTGRFWIGSAYGLYTCNSLKEDPSLVLLGGRQDNSTNLITSLCEDKKGRIWVGTGKGLKAFQVVKETPEEIQLPSTVSGLFESTTIRRMYSDQQGFMWFTTMNRGVYRVDASHDNLQLLGVPIGSRSHEVVGTAIAESNQGKLWLCTAGQEIFQFDATKLNFAPVQFDIQSFISPDELINLPSMYFDRSGVVWVGTDGLGILKSDNQRKAFRYYHHVKGDNSTLSSNFIKSVLLDRMGTLWVGTADGGLNCRRAGSSIWRHYQHDPNLRSTIPGNWVLSLLDADSLLWVGTNRGLAQFRKRDGVCTRYWNGSATALGHNTINSISSERGGRLLVGTSEGVFRFDPVLGRFEQFSPDKQILLNTNCIFVDSQNNIWIGTYASGLYLVEDSDPRSILSFLPNKNDSSALSGDEVRSVCEDPSGAIWIGSNNGLNRWHPESRTFTRVGLAEGLSSEFVYGVLSDNQGNLWVSTNRGLNKYDPVSGAVHTYGVEDGLQSYEFNTGAYSKADGGRIFFGGINGLNEFFPDSIVNNPHMPSVVLTGFKKFDIPVSLGSDPSVVREVQLDYGDNVISFQFAGLEYTNSSKNRYAYWMEGIEPGWTYSGSRREVRYTHLPPGEYVFKAKASNNDGVWNEQGLTLRVVIVPPLWQRWWFLGSAFFLALGTLVVGVRFVSQMRLRRRLERMEQEQSLQRERLRISKDMHDEVGASLTKISIMSEIALRDSSGGMEKDELQKIPTLSREVVDNIGQIVWALNPKNDKLDNLVGYLREYTSEFLESTNVTCEFHFPDSIPSLGLSAEARRNIFLVVKEALHNIVKHAQASKATLALNVSGGDVSLSIRDDGIGFSSEKENPHGNGLINMRKRIEEIGGAFDIVSSPHEGTTITVQINGILTALGSGIPQR